MESLFERLKKLIFKNVNLDTEGSFFKGASPETSQEAGELDFNDDKEQ